MTISYPLSPPSAGWKHASITWIEDNAQYIDASPFTRQKQIQVFDGERWVIQVQFDLMTLKEAVSWCAFFSSLRGAVGTFKYGDLIQNVPFGTGSGTPKVNGANQIGYSLVTDGWTPGSLVLKQGDMFAIANNPHRVENDVTANGSGQATIDIWPRARSYSDNADLTLSNWQGIFRLTDTAVATLSLDPEQFVRGFSFTAEEDR